MTTSALHAAGSTATRAAGPFNPDLEDVLRYAVALGALLVLLLPAARGSSESIGWLPLWLLGMPLSAWWALRRFNRRDQPSLRRTAGARRHCPPQARRRNRPMVRPAVPKAA